MNNEQIMEIAQGFAENGYAYLPGFFSKKLMEQLNMLIYDHYESESNFTHTNEFLSVSKTEVVPWFPQQQGERLFDEPERDLRLQLLSSMILGNRWETQYCMVMYSKKGTAGQAWHQDCPPEGSHFNLNRLVYTADIDSSLGGQVVVIPGSHREGVLSIGEPHEDLQGQIVLEPKCGDLLLLHGHCWHRVLPIHGDARFSVNYRAATAGAPEDLTDICVYRNMRYKFSTAEIVEMREPAPTA